MNRRRTRAQARLALLLAAVAGFVDAVSTLVLHGLFTAHMTGNTTKLGVGLGRGELAATLPFVVAVLVFVVAVAAGTAAIELATRRGMRSTAAPLFVLQAALVAVFMAYGSTVVRGGETPDHAPGGFYVLATAAIAALGLQAATLTKVGSVTARTTYVSGMLTRFAQEAVCAALAGHDGPSYLRETLGLESRRQARLRAALRLGIFGAYLAGAVWGAFTERRFALWSLAFPLAALLVAAAIDLARPIDQGSI